MAAAPAGPVPEGHAPAFLARLRVSELLERSRALGAHPDVLDELLDHDDPRSSLIALILSRSGTDDGDGGDGSTTLAADAQRLVAALASSRGHDAQEILRGMVSICGIGGEPVEAGDWEPSSVQLELAASGAIEVVTMLVAHAVAEEAHAHGTAPGSLVHEGMLVLATIAAKRVSTSNLLDLRTWSSRPTESCSDRLLVPTGVRCVVPGLGRSRQHRRCDEPRARRPFGTALQRRRGGLPTCAFPLRFS